MKILGVILAAGLSKRFNGNKMLFRYNGKPLLQWTIDLVISFDFDIFIFEFLIRMFESDNSLLLF